MRPTDRFVPRDDASLRGTKQPVLQTFRDMRIENIPK